MTVRQLLESSGPDGGPVLFFHAHPDDETLATGALIAALTQADVPVDLVTATRGERGDIVAGSTSARPGSVELAAHRLGELEAACRVLGVRRRCFLGEPPALAAGAEPRRYRDSGMEWIRPGLAGPAADVSADALTRSPLEAAAADLAALVEAWQPAALVSYDDGGTYGHPDHVRVHEIARAAVEGSRLPLWETASGGSAQVWLDLADQHDTLVEALGHYRSQLSLVRDQQGRVSIEHVGGQPDELTMRIGLTRVAG